MGINEIRKVIEDGRARLGVEFGSTRIKAVLIDDAGNPIAQGAHDWENKLVNNIWTYDLKDVWAGLQDCYKNMADEVRANYGCEIEKLEAIGFSAMMHGYIPFNAAGEQLAGFRTWRNTITGEAAEALTERLNFNIPQRWSIAHLYQAILNGEEHVKDIAYLTTLAGYVHWMLTGEKVLGVGEASGMFPIDSAVNDYDAAMVDSFDALVALATEISSQRHAALVGQTLEVLADGYDPEADWPLSARTRNGRLVHLRGGDASLLGQFFPARITGSSSWSLFGESAIG